MNKKSIVITPDLQILLDKAIAERDNYDKVMQDTRFHDLIAPSRPLSSDELNRRNEAARRRAHAMQNLAEYIVYYHDTVNNIPF